MFLVIIPMWLSLFGTIYSVLVDLRMSHWGVEITWGFIYRSDDISTCRNLCSSLQLEILRASRFSPNTQKQNIQLLKLSPCLRVQIKVSWKGFYRFRVSPPLPRLQLRVPWILHKRWLDDTPSESLALRHKHWGGILQLVPPKSCQWPLAHHETRTLTKRYPPAQPVTIIPIATPTRRLPNTLPTTVGIVLKNPPFAIPFITTNAISGPNVLDTGQMTSILMALMSNAMKRVLTGPMKSDKNPHARRPTAEEKLNPATRPAPVEGERPSEVE